MADLSETVMLHIRLDALSRISIDCEQRDPRRARAAAKAMRRIRDGTYGYCLSCGMRMADRETERRPEREHCSRCERAVA